MPHPAKPGGRILPHSRVRTLSHVDPFVSGRRQGALICLLLGSGCDTPVSAAQLALRAGLWCGRNLGERASANGIGRVIRQPIDLDSLWMGTDPRQLDGR